MNVPPVNTQFVEPLQKLQREVEKLNTQNRVFSNYLSGLAHDIRTPLNSIIGFSGLLREKRVSSEDQECYSRMIMRSSRRLMSLLSNLICLAKIENGSIHYFPEKVPLVDLFEELEDEMNTERQIFEKEAISLRFRLLSKDASEMITDKARLYQILKILLDNSLKFSESGEIELTVQYKVGEKFLFKVKDQGKGMDDKTLMNLFTLFPGKDPHGKIKSRGLAILVAKLLTEGLHGSISFLSRPGLGTEAVLKVPEMFV